MDPLGDEIRRRLGRAIRGVLDGEGVDETDAASAGREDDEFRIRRRVQQRRRCLEEQQWADGIDGEMVGHLGRRRYLRCAKVFRHAGVGDNDVEPGDAVLRDERFHGLFCVTLGCAVDLHHYYLTVGAVW